MTSSEEPSVHRETRKYQCRGLVESAAGFQPRSREPAKWGGAEGFGSTSETETVTSTARKKHAEGSVLGHTRAEST